MMRTAISGFLTCALLGAMLMSEVVAADFPGLGPKGDLVRIEFESVGATALVGQNARKQLLVTGVYSSGQKHNFTHDVTYAVDAGNVLRVEKDGLVVPLADGSAMITATEASGKTATIALTASRCAEELPVNFENEIVPIFTKLGCNAGGCHGKADGQNGFKLSLLGFYP